MGREHEVLTTDLWQGSWDLSFILSQKALHLWNMLSLGDREPLWEPVLKDKCSQCWNGQSSEETGLGAAQQLLIQPGCATISYRGSPGLDLGTQVRIGRGPCQNCTLERAQSGAQGTAWMWQHKRSGLGPSLLHCHSCYLCSLAQRTLG